MNYMDDSFHFSTQSSVVEIVTSNLNEKWTPHLIERLKTLIAEQMTTSQIAAALSRESSQTITRNAVIGKARRLNVPLEWVRPKAKPVDRKSKPRTVNTLAKIKAPPIVAPTPPTLAEVVANPKRLSILEIQRGECYWPTALEGETTFCGHATGSREKSWCPAHSQLGYIDSRYRRPAGAPMKY